MELAHTTTKGLSPTGSPAGHSGPEGPGSEPGGQKGPGRAQELAHVPERGIDRGVDPKPLDGGGAKGVQVSGRPERTRGMESTLVK